MNRKEAHFMESSRSGHFKALLPQEINAERLPFTHYDELMSFRIRNILLVASLYDSYILAEDGQLTELILDRYVDLNLRYAPRVYRVSTGDEALSAIEESSYDLIITMSYIADMEVAHFARQVKDRKADLPIIQLHSHLSPTIRGTQHLLPGIDYSFLWTGDATILLAIIKLLEDRVNAQQDSSWGVHVIILVEDSIRFTSSYLPIIYTELVKQTQSLMAEGINTAHRLLRQAARPKILLAQNFESALALYHQYRANLMGVISDVCFPVNGTPDPRAGIDFVRLVRKDLEDLPVLLQSSDTDAEEVAQTLKASFLNKRSPTLLHDLRRFMLTSLGFGDFVFRDPDGRGYGRASDLLSLEKLLAVVPSKSIVYHSRHNHFSRWLRARTEFDLASRIRQTRFEDFQDVDSLRKHLTLALKEFRHESQRNVVAEFSRIRYDIGSVFVKIGGGSLGGKGRGLAFANSMISRYGLSDHFKNLRVVIPNTAVIGTDVFDAFLESNELNSILEKDLLDQEVADLFLTAKLPPSIYDDLRAFLDIARYPLAVRSSSLLEDSHTLPFAGVYDTYMLSNDHQDDAKRLDQLCDAIKLVYASTFFKRSRVYRNSTALRTEEEKMAVIVQQLVGAKHGESFYPEISGVARSHNYYPYGKAKPYDGVAYLAMGLGKTVVEGGRSLRFCPRYPQQLPHFSTVEGILENAQREFWALDVSDSDRYPSLNQETLIQLDLADAMEHKSLRYIGSVYSPQNDRIYDGTLREGIPLVTFSQILKHRQFPLARTLEMLLEMGRQSMSVPVEIEFACHLPQSEGETAILGFLQIRPLVKGNYLGDISWDFEEGDETLGQSSLVLGNGQYSDLQDIIYVHPDRFDRSKTREMAQTISRFNAQLREDGKSCLLIGPGRWGSSDEWLGIPVDWTQISSARVIVEVSLEKFRVEPSQGAHFFQNLTSFNVGYMTVSTSDGTFHWEWFENQTIVQESEHVRHIRLQDSEGITVLLDGRDQTGRIIKHKLRENSEDPVQPSPGR
jgi:DNA-binding NarL/FixJ family response regulator